MLCPVRAGDPGDDRGHAGRGAAGRPQGQAHGQGLVMLDDLFAF